MAQAYAAGAVVGGNSAGDAVQSVNMINGYTGATVLRSRLREGAVDIWASSGVTHPSRGLIFGLSNAITDQHVFQYGRSGRSTNVAFSTGLPIVGMDAATGGVVTDESSLTDITGYTTSVIVDPDTYPASGGYGGPNQTLGFARWRSHLLPPGGYGYDLGTLRPSLTACDSIAPSLAVGRTRLSRPAVAAPCSSPVASGAHRRARGLRRSSRGPAGGRAHRRLAAGYAKSTDAQRRQSIAATLQLGDIFAPVRCDRPQRQDRRRRGQRGDRRRDRHLRDGAGSFPVIAGLKVKPTVLTAIKATWTSGAAALLADDAAAAPSARGSPRMSVPSRCRSRCPRRTFSPAA